MTVRENLEQWEKIYLSPYATLSMNSKGRAREEDSVTSDLFSERQGQDHSFQVVQKTEG